MCYGTVPQAAAGWPIGRMPSQFVSNNVLCAKTFANQYTMGCVCPAPGAMPDCSLDNGADPVLFNGVLHSFFTGGYDSFLAWCLSVCTCLPEKEATEFHALSFQEQLDVVSRAVAQQGLPTFSTGNSQFGANSLSIPGDTNPADLDVCSGTCVAGTNCSGDHCSCQVKASTYDPRSNTLKYLAGCIFNPSDLVGTKRDEQMPCPCNASYVSYSCCGAIENGLVWEAPEMKLGELVKEL